MHVTSRNDLIDESKETIRTSQESCRIITANVSITMKEAAAVYVAALDMSITFQLWTTHLPGSLGEIM